MKGREVGTKEGFGEFLIRNYKTKMNGTEEESPRRLWWISSKNLLKKPIQKNEKCANGDVGVFPIRDQ